VTAAFGRLIGNDASMQAVFRLVDQAARSKAAVFISGEKGTGKELCAETIHGRSPRSAAPFVAVDCGTTTPERLEGELSGSAADGGTLFLDEICELEHGLQAKLLRFIQTTQRDIRIICATSRDPRAEVATQRLRQDLFYQLHVIPLRLPPLRERGHDSLLLARHFLDRFSAEEGKSFTGFDAAAERAILEYAWPGNARQLQNMVRTIVAMHDAAKAIASMLPAGIGAPPDRAAIKPLALIEREAIEEAIDACGGNMTEAARLLGINVSTIYRKRQAWSAAAA
jgi:two-component system, repressor protein LuxO